MGNTDHVVQCQHDGYLESIKEERGEGCHMWGKLEVWVRCVGLRHCIWKSRQLVELDG